MELSNIEELKSYNLQENTIVKTLGYYNALDGGGATYLITNSNSLTFEADDSFVIDLDSGLKAKMVIENNTVNIKQLGARCQDKLNIKYDIKDYIQRYLNFLNSELYHIKLYIPSGVWYCSECDMSRAKGFDIYGDKGLIQEYPNCTVISSFKDSQSYILSLGNGIKPVYNWHLDGITFSTNDYLYDNETKGFLPNLTKSLSDSALILWYACFGLSEEIEFDGIVGRCMRIRSCWENFFEIININNVSSDAAIVFDTIDTSLNAAANCTDSEFKTLRFERITGDCISFENNCQASGIHFGNINFEPSKHEIPSNTYYDDVSKFSGQSKALFTFKDGVSISIDNIQCNNLSYRYYSRNSINYIYDTIFEISTINGEVAVNLSKLIVHYAKKTTNLILQKNENTALKSNINISETINETDYDLICNVNGFPRLSAKHIKIYLKADTSGIFIPFYQNLKIESTHTRGLLYYDSDCENELNLAVRPIKNVSSRTKFFGQFYLANSKMYINAKIELGQIFQGYIVNKDLSVVSNFDLLGTGNYKTYEVNFNEANRLLGELVYIGSRSNTNNVEASFNGYIN